MIRRLSCLNALPCLFASGVLDDSVNLLQTMVQKHKLVEQNTEEKKKCVVKGDPHVKMWSQTDADGARLGLYGTYADYWLVNTDKLKIMGRIGGVEKFDMGVVKGVAITGPLMENKLLFIPIINDEHPVSFDGDALTKFPWTSPGGNVTITFGITPNYNMYGGKTPMKDRKNSFTIKMGDAAEIQLNQDVFQHLQILADPDIVDGDTGMCNHECKDWFNCQDPICDLSKSLFHWEHPECGKVIVRVPCNPLRAKLAAKDCAARFNGDPPSGVSVQNCIEDCCSDRDQCPDRGKGDGIETCIMFGDPHIKGFDAKSSKMATYSPVGTHHLVKSEFITIQANYESGDHIKAQMEGIAFTGPLVSDADSNGKFTVLYVRPKLKGGGVMVNGVNVMPCKVAADCSSSETFYEDPNAHFNISYGSGDEISALLKEKRPIKQQPNIHTIRFREGATFHVHEGVGQGILMQIGSDLLQGVQGECGNMNGNPDDDGHPSIDKANTHCVSQSEIFIPDGAECSHIELKKCHRKKLQMPYRKQCMKHYEMKGSLRKYTPTERRLVRNCMKDCCYGGTCPSGKGDDSDDDF